MVIFYIGIYVTRRGSKQNNILFHNQVCYGKRAACRDDTPLSVFEDSNSPLHSEPLLEHIDKIVYTLVNISNIVTI